MERNVEVYYEDSGDVRRFGLRAATLKELFKQLNDAIGSFWTEKGNKYDLLYKDEENDLVMLSTPQEFEVCASCPTNREVLRIFVRRSKPVIACSASAARTNNGGIVWNRIFCDKCNVHPLEGIRYKCTVCPDYDECEKCFGSSRPQHPHALLALNDPNAEESKTHLLHGMRRRCGEGHADAARRCGDQQAALNEFPFLDFIRPYCDAAKQFAEQLSAENSGASTTPAAAGDKNATTSNQPRVEINMDELLKQAGTVFQAIFGGVNNTAETTSPSFQQQPSEPEKPIRESTHVADDPKPERAPEVAVEVATVPAAAEVEAPKKSPTPGTVTPPNGWTLVSEAGQSNVKTMNSVEDCIATLKQLGFNTDKVWLRELVQQSEGNLNRVLDELTPGGKLLV